MRFKSFTYVLLPLSIVALLLQFSIIPFAITPIMLTAALILTGLFIYLEVISIFLLVAAENGYTETVNTLLDAGADVNVKSEYGYTPLHLAIEKGSLDIVQALIDKEANVNAKDIFGQTPLHYAAKHGHLDVVKALIVAKDIGLNATDQFGYTPLHRAVMDGHLDVVKALIVAKDIGLNATDQFGYTPLHRAVMDGHAEIAAALIAKGANVNAANLNATDEFSYTTPLHLAIKNGHIEIAKTLIEKGANVNAKDDNSKTPLHIAAIQGSLEIVKVLIEVEGIDLNTKDRSCGYTPLHLAAKNGHTETVKVLLKEGADIHRLNSYNKNPLDLAIEGEHAETIIVLIQASKSRHNQNLTKLRADKESPKHRLQDIIASAGVYAKLRVLNITETAYEISTKEIKAAYKKAALKTHPDKGGTSASFRAVNDAKATLLNLCPDQNKKAQITQKIEQEEKLLNKVQEQDCNGKWQKIADKNKKNTEEQEKLAYLQKGVKPAQASEINAKSNDGKTPLHYATENGHTKTSATIKDIQIKYIIRYSTLYLLFVSTLLLAANFLPPVFLFLSGSLGSFMSCFGLIQNLPVIQTAILSLISIPLLDYFDHKMGPEKQGKVNASGSGEFGCDKQPPELILILTAGLLLGLFAPTIALNVVFIGAIITGILAILAIAKENTQKATVYSRIKSVFNSIFSREDKHIMLKLFAAVTLSAAAGMIGSWLLTAMVNIWSWLSPTIVNIGSWLLTNLVNAGCVLGAIIAITVVAIVVSIISIFSLALEFPFTTLLIIIMNVESYQYDREPIVIVGLILDATPASSWLSAKIGIIVNWLLTGLGMIGHGLAVLGNGLLTGLGMIGHGLVVMGSWIATNTVTLAKLFYTAAAAHPAIAIPLLAFTAALIINSCWKSFNSKGAYEVNGSDNLPALGSEELNTQPSGNAKGHEADKSAQPVNSLFSCLGF